MKRMILPLLLLALPFYAASALAQGHVNINLSVSGEVAPGVYGQVNIGDRQPEVVYEQPIIIREPRHASRPLYLHVPPGHAKHWDQYCAEYNACDRQVYFVRSSEYRDFADERHDEKKKDKHESKHGHDKGRKHDDDHGDDEDQGDDGDREHNNGHGHGRD